MAQQTRIYFVKGPTTQTLVEATSQAQAVRHVVKGAYTVTIPTPLEIVQRMTGGAKVEKAAAGDGE